ncbi:PREDICTED: myeloid-associated differentiation marker-like protein 2 [Cyprinodon variegatus]|uniref:myeloid-associated differentiation marker-like protein 2 n=1 Tax=Cyprinodon variegatus TaxID=28743 RepID=UPI000742759F|nr:PREDICTED: myeloid-associated differentiation marker-like protein 2 [Cyprinodon variegatus]
MWGPFSGFQGILRLLEIIFSAVAFIIVICKGRMVVPWGVWCEFVWVFCIIVPLVLAVVESKKLHILLAAFLPNWADLTFGLTGVCSIMIVSATGAFLCVFVCLTCIADILCLIFSFAATVCFLIDAIMQKMKLPSGYMTSLRGTLRISEAFVACIILTAATDHFVRGEWFYKPFGMTLCAIIFGVCLLVTVVILVLNLLKLLQCLLTFKLSLVEFVFNIVAVVLYLLAVILWTVFGYKRPKHNPYTCIKCAYADMNTVTVGSILNLILYIIDAFFSLKSL